MARWQSVMEQTRWRLAARVLPFIMLSMILLGMFSWIVFSRHFVREFVVQQREQASTDIERLARRASLAGMVLEARRADLVAAARQAGAPVACDDLLGYELMSGVALHAGGPDAGPEPSRLALQPRLRTPANRRRLSTWFYTHDPVDNRPLLAAAFRGPQGALRASLGDDNPWHPVVVYPPLLLEVAAADGKDAGRTAVLPVLVVDSRRHDDAGDPHAVYFLDLQGLAAEVQPHGWWCLIDGADRVLAGAAGAPAAGTLLAEYPRQDDDGPFHRLSGAEMATASESIQLMGTLQGGSRLAPWVVVRTRGTSVPVTLLTLGETDALRAVSLRFAAGVMLAALLAMVLPLVGVSRVARGLGDRLALLARNLEAVARGDYSRRLNPGRPDEVGRLIGYFNLMTISLDEAHRQLRANEAGLQVTVDTMRELDRAKDDFLVLVSHEVRTPLTSIMAGVDLLKSSLKNAGPEDGELLARLHLDEILSIIESSGQRLGGFMTDAIQMTSIQSSDKELNLAAVPVGHLMEVGLCGVRERARGRNIQVVNGLDDSQDWCVLCDQNVLKLALEKILSNAVRHNHDGGRIIIREADRVPGIDQTELMPSGEMIHHLMSQPSFRAFEDEEIAWRLIEIWNSGEPIPAHRRKALFGKFELVGRIEHHQRGSGLSLPIAQAAVQHHGGRIFLDSSRGGGNSFYLLLPTLHAAASEVGACLWHDAGQGDRRVAGHEQVGQVGDAAGLDVELDDVGAGLPGGGDEPGGGIDGAGRADDEAEVTVGGGVR